MSVNIVSSQESYPQIKGYFSVVHPIVSVDKDQSHFNFSDTYTVGFPTGINILKSDHIGFSFEITPFIKVENGVDKMSNVLYHPGVLFRYKKGFTFITRLAFETSGRYGFTPVFNKVFLKKNGISYFLATPFPVRFGNEKPISISPSFQIGISF
ncbi:MAG: hypothetical protein V4548_03205 [Bacteroidota bacterium]